MLQPYSADDAHPHDENIIVIDVDDARFYVPPNVSVLERGRGDDGRTEIHVIVYPETPQDAPQWAKDWASLLLAAFVVLATLMMFIIALLIG